MGLKKPQLLILVGALVMIVLLICDILSWKLLDIEFVILNYIQYNYYNHLFID